MVQGGLKKSRGCLGPPWPPTSRAYVNHSTRTSFSAIIPNGTECKTASTFLPNGFDIRVLFEVIVRLSAS